jgi:hypothetical protein
MQEGVLHDPNYAAWRDEITNDQRKGANPRTCRSGDLKSQKEKLEDEQEKEEKEKKFRTGV